MPENQTELILAGPGTGKTTTIVNRVVSLIRSINDKDDGIILCTFTRKATEELTQRIYRKLSTSQVNRINFLIGTIHSICYELLLRYSSIDYSDFSILTEDEQTHFIYSKLSNLGYDNKNGWHRAEELAQIFNKINDQEIDVSQLDLSKDDELRLACMAYPIYRRILKYYKLFDFASIQSTFLEEIQSDKHFKNEIKKHYKYFFVDEYQDINQIQHKIFKCLSSPEFNLTVVGDDDQCIYEFRGSDVNIIRNFHKEFIGYGANVKETILNTNYRSTKSIVGFTNNLLSLSDKNLNKEITASRNTESHLPVIIYEQTPIQEARFIAEAISEIKSRNIVTKYSDIAILQRSVKYHSAELILALKEKEIPYQVVGAGNFFESIIGKEFMALLDFYLAKDQNYKSEFYEKLAQIDASLGCDLTTLYSNENYLDSLDSVFNNKRYHSCIDLAYDIMNACDMFERYAGHGEDLGILTSIIFSFDNFSMSYDPWNLYGYLTYLANTQNISLATDSTSDCVQLMTIHQSKGLEFPVVFMPGLVNRRRNTSTADKLDIAVGRDNGEDEEFRILYVGCTRAEDLLILSGYDKNTETSRKSIEKNRYIQEYLNKFSGYSTSLDYDKLSKQQFRSRDASIITNKALSYNSIELYLMCPRAYMYSYVWHLATSRIGGMEFGQNIHSIIEIILRKIIAGTKLSDINVDDEINNAWRLSPIRLAGNENRYKNAAADQIKTFINKNKDILNKDAVFSSEDRFDITVDDNLITGRFDAVFKFDDAYRIVDFKTGDKKDYTDQLSFYHLCFKEKYQSNLPVELSVYYLKSGEYVDIAPLKADEVREAIKKVADRIKNNEFDPTPGNVCGNCAYNSICKFKE